MAIVGHFENLVEAQKLVQSVLLAGVVQETYQQGQLLQRLPVMTIDSKSIKYNRQAFTPTASFFDIHEQIPWTADQTYTSVEVELKRVARADILDNFIQMTYRNPNDYLTQLMKELTLGCTNTIEDKIIYGSATTDPKEFDGLNVLCPPTNAHTFALGNQDQDQAEGALTMLAIRQCIDACKPKPDILITTPTLRNMISAAQFEKGVSANTNLAIALGLNEFGARTTYLDGIPLMVSDYLVNEVTDTGVKDAGNDSGWVSLYGLRFGQIMDGGLCLCTGGDTGGVNFFRVVKLDDLEDYDAAGIRLVAYCALALGSTKAMTHIHSINEDAAVT